MTYEQMPEEWQEWIDLTPLECFRRSEAIFAQYLARGGSLDPDPVAEDEQAVAVRTEAGLYRPTGAR